MDRKAEWDRFCYTAKNATFLFQRDFMDYHSDRFTDHSLMMYKDEELIAVLPANIKDRTVYSHLESSASLAIVTQRPRDGLI